MNDTPTEDDSFTLVLFRKLLTITTVSSFFLVACSCFYLGIVTNQTFKNRMTVQHQEEFKNLSFEALTLANNFDILSNEIKLDTREIAGTIDYLMQHQIYTDSIDWSSSKFDSNSRETEDFEFMGVYYEQRESEHLSRIRAIMAYVLPIIKQKYSNRSIVLKSDTQIYKSIVITSSLTNEVYVYPKPKSGAVLNDFIFFPGRENQNQSEINAFTDQISKKTALIWDYNCPGDFSLELENNLGTEMVFLLPDSNIVFDGQKYAFSFNRVFNNVGKKFENGKGVSFNVFMLINQEVFTEALTLEDSGPFMNVFATAEFPFRVVWKDGCTKLRHILNGNSSAEEEQIEGLGHPDPSKFDEADQFPTLEQCLAWNSSTKSEYTDIIEELELPTVQEGSAQVFVDQFRERHLSHYFISTIGAKKFKIFKSILPFSKATESNKYNTDQCQVEVPQASTSETSRSECKDKIFGSSETSTSPTATAARTEKISKLTNISTECTPIEQPAKAEATCCAGQNIKTMQTCCELEESAVLESCCNVINGILSTPCCKIEGRIQQQYCKQHPSLLSSNYTGPAPTTEETEETQSTPSESSPSGQLFPPDNILLTILIKDQNTAEYIHELYSVEHKKELVVSCFYLLLFLYLTVAFSLFFISKLVSRVHEPIQLIKNFNRSINNTNSKCKQKVKEYMNDEKNKIEEFVGLIRSIFEIFDNSTSETVKSEEIQVKEEQEIITENNKIIKSDGTFVNFVTAQKEHKEYNFYNSSVLSSKVQDFEGESIKNILQRENKNKNNDDKNEKIENFKEILEKEIRVKGKYSREEFANFPFERLENQEEKNELYLAYENVFGNKDYKE